MDSCKHKRLANSNFCYKCRMHKDDIEVEALQATIDLLYADNIRLRAERGKAYLEGIDDGAYSLRKAAQAVVDEFEHGDLHAASSNTVHNLAKELNNE